MFIVIPTSIEPLSAEINGFDLINKFQSYCTEEQSEITRSVEFPGVTLLVILGENYLFHNLSL